MKNQNILLLFLAFFFINANFLQANGAEYETKLVATCSAVPGEYHLEIFLKSSSPSTAFILRDQTYRFYHSNTSAIANPVADGSDGMQGVVPTPSPNQQYTGVYNNHTMNVSGGSLFAYIVTGQGYYITNQWTKIGRIEFDILDECEAVDFTWIEHQTSITGERNGVLASVTGLSHDFESGNCLDGPNGQYDVKIVADCSNLNSDEYIASIQLRAKDASTAFHVSEQNYRFSFTRFALSNPTPVAGVGLTGLIGSSFYETPTTTGSADSVVSFNIELTGGPGQLIDDQWFEVGQVRFDVEDPCAAVEIKIHDKAPENFPPTFVGEKHCDALYTADENLYFFENDAACPTGPNGQYDVKIVADCSNLNSDEYIASIQLRAKDASTAFHVSEQNYRFSFTRFALSNPTPVAGVGLTGFIGSSFYSNPTTTGSADSVVSFNIELTGGPGQLIDDQWFEVGQVRFDVEDPCAAVEIKIHDKAPENFPPTFVGEKYCEALYTADENLYFFENDAACPTGCPPAFTGGDQTSSLQGNTDIASTLNKTTMKTFPNPASSNLTVELNLATTTDSKLMVTDFTGRTIARQVIAAHNGQQQINIDVTDYKAGFYFITLETDVERVSKKVVVVK